MTDARPYPAPASVQFSLATRRRRGSVVVEISGELDLLTAQRLQEALVHLLESGERDVVLDLARLRFCDSAGISVFVAAERRFARNNGKVRLRNPTATVRSVLDLASLEHDVVDLTVGDRHGASTGS